MCNLRRYTTYLTGFFLTSKPHIYGTKNTKNMCIAALAIIGIFLPSIFLDFAYEVDYWRFAYDDFRIFHPETLGMIKMGRPISALIVNLHFMFIEEITDFKFARLVNLLTTVCAFLFFSSILIKKLQVNSFLSIVTGYCLFLLPSSQLYVMLLGSLASGPLNLIIVMFAYWAINSGTDDPNLRYRLFCKSIGYGLWFLSLFVYPPTSFFIFVFIFAKILFVNNKKKWVSLRLEIFQNILIISMLCLVYFVFVKFLLKPITQVIWPVIISCFPDSNIPVGNVPEIYEMNISLNLADKLYLIKAIINEHFGFWYGHYFKHSEYIFLISVFIFGLLIVLHKTQNKDFASLRTFAEKIAIGYGIWLFSLLPLLLPACNIDSPGFLIMFAGYRSLFPSVAIGALLFVVIAWKAGNSLMNLKLQKLPLTALALVVTVFAIHSIHSASINQNRELVFLRNEIAQLDLKKLKSLMVYLPQGGRDALLVEAPLRLDRALMASNSVHNIKEFPEAVLKEFGIPRGDIYVHIIDSDSPLRHYNIESPPEVEKIDMNEAGYFPDSRKSVNKNVIAKKKSIKADIYATNNLGIQNVIDGNPGTFWESVLHPIPFKLQITYVKPTWFSGYSIQADQYAPNRMPNQWSVYGSKSQSEKLVLINTIKDQPSWNKLEVRNFDLNPQEKYLRIVFDFITPTNLINDKNEGIMRIAEVKIMESEEKNQ